MMQRILNSKNLVAFILAAATGMTLYFRMPFPEGNIFVRVMALRSPSAFEVLKYSYSLFLFSTPYIGYSVVFSGLYIFALKAKQRIRAGKLPLFPDPQKRDDLFLVLGEVHNPRKQVPAECPQWLVIPERGLFTGVAILGAIGSGKTSCCMYPFAEQILAYRAGDTEKRIGGLVLEVKGDFCHRVNEILGRHGRAEDYIEISLDSKYRYNPLQSDLDAYALAYNIASLLNNLFGRGKEPFWQQAYTNLVKFIILLHKVAFDYVTLFDVYECAIDNATLERRINEAERRLTETDSVLLWEEEYLKHPRDLETFEFRLDEESKRYRAPLTPGLAALLKDKAIQWEAENEKGKKPVPQDKKEQLEAVKRWFNHDWRRIEPKLRTSIVEGISVFLSLFDDNPSVKRTFCPPPECYDPQANADFKFGKPLPSFKWLIENGKVCALNFPIAMNAGLAKALGVMMKLDFERAVLNRVPEMEAHPDQHFRQVMFICDEYQHFATVGESEPTGDEKFFSLSRQPKCIPIIATQSISSLKSALPGEAWRTLLQTFRTKIFLALSDDFSARTASELCGREDKQALVREFDGDPAATDSTRVLRLPGFANKKYEADFYVEATAESPQTYHLRDFKLEIGSQDALRRHALGHKQSASDGNLSQSEHDWAYAKRALARGDHPDEIIRRIADYRADDKADPLYYAHRTVNKAQQQLASKTSREPNVAAKSENLQTDSRNKDSASLREV